MSSKIVNVSSVSTANIQGQNAFSQAASSLTGLLGFTFLQIGLCQPKNSSSILMANSISSCIAILASWSVGFAFCFGSESNSFVSYSSFFLINADAKEKTAWLFYCSLAIIFTVICNGGFAERLQFPVYLSATIFLTGIAFPIGCHWSWHQNGWLYKNIKAAGGNQQLHVYDSSGMAILHISAGSIALFGGILLGARPARQASRRFHLLPGNTNINVFLGGFFALVSLLCLNGTLVNRHKSYSNGIISSMTSSLVAIMFKRSRVAGEISNVRTLINGALTGLVATSSETWHGFYPYASLGIGMAAGIVYIACSSLLKHFKFDDAVDSVSVHLGGGVWGQIAASLVDTSRGVFYVGSSNSLKWFGWSLLGVAVYVVWAGFATIILMLPFHLFGKLKYSTENVDTEGIDAYIHKEPAYPDVRVLALNFPNEELAASVRRQKEDI